MVTKLRLKKVIWAVGFSPLCSQYTSGWIHPRALPEKYAGSAYDVTRPPWHCVALSPPLFHIKRFLTLWLDALLKNVCALHWVEPRNSASKRALHFLRPSLLSGMARLYDRPAFTWGLELLYWSIGNRGNNYDICVRGHYTKETPP